MMNTTRQNFAKFLMMLAAGALLASCSGNPITNGVGDLFSGGDDDDEILDDEGRIPVLALEDIVRVDDRFRDLEVTTPPSYVNSSWPQPGGEADHTLHHLSASLELDVEWSADVGTASERLARLTSPPVIADGRVFVVARNCGWAGFCCRCGI